jgi:hypothetical protein
MAIEDRLEELFMNDANNRRVASVNVPQRPSPWRGVAAFAGAAAIVAIALVAVILGLRGGQPAASPTATATATVIPSATATSSAIPTQSLPVKLPPQAGSIYNSPAGYSVTLPTGWRRSDLQSRMTPKDNPDELSIETFTTRTAADEAEAMRRSDTGVGPAQIYTTNVAVYRNSRNETAMAFAQRVKGGYGLVPLSVEPTTVDGRAAVKTTFKFATDNGQSFYTVYVQDGDRIWAIGYFLAPSNLDTPAGATEAGVRGIVESFKFAR